MQRDIPFSVVRGFCMGAADIVPGVSGGTIALVFGIYHRLVTAIRTGSSALGRLARLDGRGALDGLRRVEWSFLLPLGVGIVVAVLALASVLEHQLEEHPVQLAAVFLGLVAGSVVVTWNLLTRRDPRRLGIMLAVGIAIFLALGLRSGTTEDEVSQLDEAAALAFFASGAIAICAMILPGISGSFILVMLGMYGPVLAAVNDRDALSLGVFLVGAVIGLGLFSQVLHWALNAHYDSVMAALIGLMLGSMRVLWPWPAGVDTTVIEAPSDPVVLPIVLAVVACAVVIAINAVAKALEHRTTHEEVDELRAT